MNISELRPIDHETLDLDWAIDDSPSPLLWGGDS